jgi:hypothetical protein
MLGGAVEVDAHQLRRWFGVRAFESIERRPPARARDRANTRAQFRGARCSWRSLELPSHDCSRCKLELQHELAAVSIRHFSAPPTIPTAWQPLSLTVSCRSTVSLVGAADISSPAQRCRDSASPSPARPRAPDTGAAFARDELAGNAPPRRGSCTHERGSEHASRDRMRHA